MKTCCPVLLSYSFNSSPFTDVATTAYDVELDEKSGCQMAGRKDEVVDLPGCTGTVSRPRSELAPPRPQVRSVTTEPRLLDYPKS
jgi:hypothetical protein